VDVRPKKETKGRSMMLTLPVTAEQDNLGQSHHRKPMDPFCMRAELTFPLSSTALIKRWQGEGTKFEGYIWLETEVLSFQRMIPRGSSAKTNLAKEL
jgi:hypothetical protein